MDGIVEIEGEELHMLLAEIQSRRVLGLRVVVDGGVAKFKVNEGRWTPWLGNPDEGPTPRCSECGANKSEHRARTYHCPVAGDDYAVFSQSHVYVPLVRA